MGIHKVINVNNLNMFKLSFLDESISIQNLVNNILDFKFPLF